jgi:acetolactate synthase-1/2/3 large subunit
VTPSQKRPKLKPLGKAAPIYPRPRGSVRPQYLMQVIQRRVVEESDALLMTESGNAFAWGNHFLRFTRPGQYRTSAQYGAMGQVVAGVVGAALARRGRAVAVVGDGAMLMNNEISTAVKYGAKALWIVLNDQLYGITHQAMLAWGFQPVETELPVTDFVGMARSLGADGAKVTSEPELDSILCDALKAVTPFVLDVAISREEISPVVIARINQLRQQQGAISNKS